MRNHRFIPASSDFTEWICEYCGFETEGVGPPCQHFRVIYKMDGSDEEHEVTCEEIEIGAIAVFQVHDI